MNDLDHEESLSTSSDSSLVILNHGSLPHTVNDDLNKTKNSYSLETNENFSDVYDVTDLNKCDNFQSKYQNGNSLSEEEIQKKFFELTKENSHLKETLNQNNLAIKSQLDTFIMWQQEVLKTHETHKQKFLETKELILKLRAENKCLKKHLESSGIIDLNGCELHESVNITPKDLSKPNSKIEEYKDLIEKNENLDLENKKLKEDLRASQKEVLKLNKELEDIVRENNFLNHKSDSFEKNSFEHVSYKSLPNLEARAQISNLFELLEVEKGKVLKLTKELEQTKANNSEALHSKLSMTDKSFEYIEKLNDENDSFEDKNERYSSFTNWMSLAEQNLKENKIKAGDKENLVSDIKQLKSHVNNEEDVLYRENQDYLAKLKNQFYLLLEDYKALQVKLRSLKNRDLNYEKLHQDISTLTTKLETKDKELILKQQEIDELKKTVEKLNLESQEMEVLKVQAQIYQSDFNEERAARTKLVEEKEKLSEQIRFLRSRIIALEGKNFEENNSKSSLESPGEKTKCVCPRCLASFPDSMFERHLEECFIDDFF